MPNYPHLLSSVEVVLVSESLTIVNKKKKNEFSVYL